jgi:hypothetical protein
MKEHSWHRRHAVQVAASLPNDIEDALVVLRLATQAVTDFLAVDEPPKKSGSVVSLIGGGECA